MRALFYEELRSGPIRAVCGNKSEKWALTRSAAADVRCVKISARGNNRPAKTIRNLRKDYVLSFPRL